MFAKVCRTYCKQNAILLSSVSRLFLFFVYISVRASLYRENDNREHSCEKMFFLTLDRRVEAIQQALDASRSLVKLKLIPDTMTIP